jgi:hypothetical protein
MMWFSIPCVTLYGLWARWPYFDPFRLQCSRTVAFSSGI